MNNRYCKQRCTVPNEILIPQLGQKLQNMQPEQKQLEIEVGKEFTHEVIIQGDESIPYEVLLRVMYTCGQSEFNKMRLLTVAQIGCPLNNIFLFHEY